MALYLLKPSEMATAWLFGGLPRSGKSYHAAAVAYKWLRAGGHVVSNMQLNIPSGFRGRAFKGKYFRLETGRTFVADLERIRSDVDGHILLIIDEAASIFDGRNFRNFPPDVRAFLAQHAKMRVSIITIVHTYDMVDASFRKLAGYYVHHVSFARATGFAGLLISLFVPGLMFRYTQALLDGEKTGGATEKKLLFGRRKIFDFYDTFQIAEGSFRGSEALKKALAPSYGMRRGVLFVSVIWALWRFTPLNVSWNEQIAVDLPVGKLVGEVVLLDRDTGLVEINVGDDYFRVWPDREFRERYGSDAFGWLGQTVEVDVWTTALEKLDDITSGKVLQYVQKK